jgi:hypothetical protein
MKKTSVKIYALSLILALILSQTVSASSAVNNAVNRTAAYIYRTTANPQVGSIGGEWAVIGLARSGYNAPDLYYENYYRAVEKYVRDRNGVLHHNRHTEYSRVILALTAAGYDPRNVAGYNLTVPLGDFERTLRQGLNGAVWALIALDSMNYPMPKNPAAVTQATRDLYIDEILKRQLRDGGWAMSGETGDPSMTGMALQALAKYQDKSKVKTAADKAIDFLSKNQDRNGGYTSWGTANIGNAAQVLVALCELGISPGDSRFVKNGNTLADNILSFRNSDGSFKNAPGDTEGSRMATEQALYALAAAQRALNDNNSLYRMDDTERRRIPPNRRSRW